MMPLLLGLVAIAHFELLFAVHRLGFGTVVALPTV